LGPPFRGPAGARGTVKNPAMSHCAAKSKGFGPIVSFLGDRFWARPGAGLGPKPDFDRRLPIPGSRLGELCYIHLYTFHVFGGFGGQKKCVFFALSGPPKVPKVRGGIGGLGGGPEGTLEGTFEVPCGPPETAVWTPTRTPGLTPIPTPPTPPGPPPDPPSGGGVGWDLTPGIGFRGPEPRPRFGLAPAGWRPSLACQVSSPRRAPSTPGTPRDPLREDPPGQNIEKVGFPDTLRTANFPESGIPGNARFRPGGCPDPGLG
jgi:hypothetical protein